MNITNPNAGIIPVAPSPSTTSKASGTTLGKDDFLKLLVGQLQHQDPMQPSDDSQWIGQMAQFSQLEQMTNMAGTSTQIAGSLDRSGALSLIGHTVTYTDDATKQSVSGTVQEVDMDDSGNATLTVDGKTGVDVTKVTQVK